jgi:hypothetical protein
MVYTFQTSPNVFENRAYALEGVQQVE